MREMEVDRMSQLPEFINHHIMSFLDNPKERVRMSVLSKNWFGITASFPILDFDIRKFEGFISFPELAKGNLLDKFFKYVEYTTSRFCQQNVSAHTFKLITSLWDATQVDIVDKCVELILDKGVQVLVIDIRRGTYFLPWLPNMYRVSNKLVSASSLTSLTIHNCDLPSSLMVDTIKFKSLKLLKLKYVRIDEKMIKHLTTSCPLLEELTLKLCGVDVSTLCVYGLQNLQRLKFFIADPGGVDRIDIEAPNLCFLKLTHSVGRAPCFNVASCKKLTTVFYCGYPSPTWKGLADFSSNFPYLETLFLELDKGFESLNLSSHSLRTFVLHSGCDFEDLDIDTPNLLSFEYTFNSSTPFAVKRDSASSKLRMKCHPWNFVDALWFEKLRRFLDKKVRFKELKLRFRAFPFEVEELRKIQSTPFELDHVDLEPDIIKEMSAYLAVVDAVLWCCRPRSLTLGSLTLEHDFEEWSHIVKFTYEKLLLQEDEGETNIQIVMSSSSNAKKHFNDLTSLLTASPRDGPRPIITFIKEQVVQEAGYENPSVWMEGSTHTQSTSLQKV